MNDRLRRKLHRMGVTQGLKKIQPPQSPTQPEPPAHSDAQTLPGEAQTTQHGPVWVDCRNYAPDYVHGDYALSDLRAVSVEALTLLGEANLGQRPVFLDTETTGLAGGAGTLVFLTGVGVWDGEHFVLHQVFLRDPAEEPAALRYLDAIFNQATGLVTFNGRAFDVPLLQNRFILNRLLPQWTSLPHLDLLTVARQLWRDHLSSRRLGVLETQIVHVTRTETDIDSGLIPGLYLDYLRTGETDAMARIFYHNLVDVLSLASLLVHAARLVTLPEEMALAPGEWVGVGRLWDRAGREAEAFAAWERALAVDEGLDAACAVRLWREMGARCKRRAMWEQAFALWDAWAERLPLDTEPWVERAKYYEWKAKDLHAALAETESALERALQHPRSLDRELLLEDLRHRQARLQRRITSAQ